MLPKPDYFKFIKYHTKTASPKIMSVVELGREYKILTLNSVICLLNHLYPGYSDNLASLHSRTLWTEKILYDSVGTAIDKMWHGIVIRFETM